MPFVIAAVMLGAVLILLAVLLAVLVRRRRARAPGDTRTHGDAHVSTRAPEGGE